MSYPNTHSKYRAYVSFFVAAIAVLSVGALIVTAQPAKRPITLDDFAKLRSVGDPQRSPDGKWVAYTVSAIDVEKDKRDTDLWMVSWDGTEQVRLTSGPDGESSPRWSPDGRYLSFLASRGTEEEKKTGAQVWLLDRRGGEAQKLTDIKGGVGDYAWSPDGKRLALVVSDPDPADEPEKMEGWKRKTKPPVVIDRYHFKQDRDGYLKTPASHLWLFDVAAGKAEQLTNGPVSTTRRRPGRRTERRSRSSATGDPTRTARRTPTFMSSRRRPERSRAVSRISPGPTTAGPPGAPTAGGSPSSRATNRASGLQPQQARHRPRGGRPGDGPDRNARSRRSAARSSGRPTGRASSSSSTTTGPCTSAACRPRAGPSRR